MNSNLITLAICSTLFVSNQIFLFKWCACSHCLLHYDSIQIPSLDSSHSTLLCILNYVALLKHIFDLTLHLATEDWYIFHITDDQIQIIGVTTLPSSGGSCHACYSVNKNQHKDNSGKYYAVSSLHNKVLRPQSKWPQCVNQLFHGNVFKTRQRISRRFPIV